MEQTNLGAFDWIGTHFLMLYGVMMLVVLMWLLFSRINLLSRYDGKKKIPAHLNPYEIAYLSQGERGIILSATLTLIEKGVIEVYEGKILIKNYNPMLSDKIQELVFHFFKQNEQNTQTISSFFLNHDYMNKIREACSSVKDNLVHEGLIFSNEVINIFKTMRLASFLALTVVGCIKIGIGIMRDKPVFYLVILTIIATIALIFITAIPKHLTPKGKQYLQDIQQAYEKLRIQIKENPDEIHHLQMDSKVFLGLLVGIYGANIFANTPYNILNTQRYNYNTGSYDSTGGIGCASSSGDSGGGSCGSSCGGGCGGCGGGD